MSRTKNIGKKDTAAQMSFLDHLDELRRRLVNCVIIVVIAFVACFAFSDDIYDFLSIPVRKALSEAERRELPVAGLTGDERITPLSALKEGSEGRFVFDRATKLGASVVQPGTSVAAKVERDSNEILGVFTAEPIITINSVIPAGVRLPVDIAPDAVLEQSGDERMVVTTAVEPFTLFVTVSLYAAIAFSMPFLLWQIGRSSHQPFILMNVLT